MGIRPVNYASSPDRIQKARPAFARAGWFYRLRWDEQELPSGATSSSSALAHMMSCAVVP